MIVTVTVVRMVQMAIDEIVHMVAVWHRLVSATGSMSMTGFVAAAIMIGRTTLWVL
jgi:hypothetical protein